MALRGAHFLFQYHAEIARAGLGLRGNHTGGEEQSEGKSHNGGNYISFGLLQLAGTWPELFLAVAQRLVPGPV